MKRIGLFGIILLFLSGCGTLNDKELSRPSNVPLGATVRAPFQGMIANARQPDAVVGSVDFEPNQSELTLQNRQALDRVAVALNQRTGKIILEGHSDPVDKNRNKTMLGYKRALAVAEYLKTAGLWEERMVIQSFGDSRPIQANENGDGNPNNRCVVIKMLAQGEGMPGDDAVRIKQGSSKKTSAQSESILQSPDVPLQPSAESISNKNEQAGK